MPNRVSPPTRGWTSRSPPSPPSCLGFPAHAGMDPWQSDTTPARFRFPRPRGDGPVLASTPRMVPPGFPAHAGMDPAQAAPASATSRFPRPRGDGPFIRAILGRTDQVSPPTRGWTLLRAALDLGAVGFPAHAGMDRVYPDGGGRAGRFPRPRGDGPMSEDVPAVSMEVSPPTRGWTRRWRSASSEAHGFPAHAGMDLPHPSVAVVVPGFPRPRGDGPWQHCAHVAFVGVSPPTRGWTS